MKALTLTQPWASLVILGEKHWETRSWRPYGIKPGDRIAIHAAKSWGRADVDFAFELVAAGWLPLDRYAEADISLPRGAVLGTVEFTGYRPTEGMVPGNREDILGDFTSGRFAWGLARPREFPEPIPCRGAQGLWEWER